MPVSGAKACEIAQRRREVIRLHVQGLTHVQIAQRLGMATKTIERDVAAVKAEWKAGNATDILALRNEQLAKIQAIESEAWAAWTASKAAAKKQSITKTEQPGGAASGEVVTQLHLQDREGDKQWLDVLLQCHDRTAKLFGLEPRPDDAAAPSRPPVYVFLPDNGRDPLRPGESYVQPPIAILEAGRPATGSDPDRPASETVDVLKVGG